ncbi:glycosyltransferase family 4 protein [Terrabacter terrigena]|uniref:Glycosyltransferase family 4 protein n=1 Tax=Terrabacter terrigena TaxID=574718 RepID=A0ABW3MV55_9MICO
MRTIIQIAPEIGPGTGVGGVAHHLEQEWSRQGHRVLRFTLDEAGASFIPRPQGRVSGRLALLARVVWFSTVGTARARRFVREHPGADSICHNDALAGDVYVNHGLVRAAMKARGHYALRMVRNPLHLFTAVRDRRRYGSTAHRVVVNLSAQDDRLLRSLNPRLVPATAVIANGVDTDAYAPPTAADREAVRGSLGVAADEVLAIFVGHEYARKGLDLVIDALDRCPATVRVVVVGGSPAMVESMRARPAAVRHAARITFVGASPDPRVWLRGADVLCLPSAYEASPLVVLEALAMGVPVIGTRTGSIADVVHDGVDGYLVDRSAEGVAAALTSLTMADQSSLQAAARATALEHSWSRVAARYLDVFDQVGVAPPRTREPA